MNTLSKAARLTLLSAAIILLALTGVPKSNAQATDSNLVGTVTDASGAAVANAKVVATNKGTNVKSQTTTNSAGDYRLNNLPIGLYDVTATANGFAVRTIANVQLDLNHTGSVNLALAVGDVTQTIDVTESAALIDTSTSQLQTNFDSNIAINSPVTGISKTINGAGIYNLSLLGAGVTTSGGIGQGTGPSIAGQRPENNSFSIDGVNNNNAYTTGPAAYVSNEAIAQMNIAQNQFSAEFGGASGGVFNVIVKSGTNQLHGAIFEYFQNRNLNALDYNVFIAGNTSNPRFDNNRLGAGIGGPIIKDKLFYYGNFEYNPLGQASVPGNPVDAPTAAGLATLNSMAGINKTNLGVFTKYVPVATSVDPANPFTTVNGVNIPLGALSFASPNFNNAYHAIIAIDYNMSSKDQIRGRFVYDNSAGIDPNANLPVFFEPNPDVNKAVAVSEFHNFSPTMENELRVSYNRHNAATSAGSFAFPGLSAFPNLSFDDLGLQVGPDPNTPTGSIAGAASLQENLTKNVGRHTFKAGYSLTDVILTGTFVQRVRGDYDYTSLQEYLLDQKPSGSAFGTPGSGQRTVGAAGGVPFGFLSNAAFVQDDWRVRPNLTINLGLRYEYVTEPVGSRAQSFSSVLDVPGVITFHAPTTESNNWSPRLGFAYSPGNDGKWSIRGGVGRSYDNTYINLNQNADPLFYAATSTVTAATPLNNFLANGGLNQPPVQIRSAVSAYTWDMKRPYALTGTLGVQRLVGKDYVLEARYVYTKGVHLWNQTHQNMVDQVTPTNSLPTYFTTPSASQLAGDTLTLGQIQSTIVPGGTSSFPNNKYASVGFTSPITSYEPWGNSRYNGLALQMNKRYSNGFSYILAYTWSHAQDDSTATNFSTIMSPRRAEDFQNMANEWSDSALDRRQRLTLTPVYDFRPFKNRGWAMKNVIGNWNLSGTYTFQSPEMATVQDGVDANMNGESTGDRPITNPNGIATVGSTVNGLNSAGQIVAAGSAKIVAYVAANPNARYVTAGLGALDNTGRNTFPMGRTNNIDFSLSKKINFTERVGFSIGVQAFNLFNHSQFTGGYLSDVTPYQTNAISNAVFVQSNSSFGKIWNFFPSNSRELNLVARITF